MSKFPNGIKVDPLYHSSFSASWQLSRCGLFQVPMVSGRGLEHTGGTLDKLEAIPGFRVSLSLPDMKTVVEEVGCCIVGQTRNLVPADKKMYATRDVTGTTANIGLIVGEKSLYLVYITSD